MSITTLLYDAQKLQLSGTPAEYKWQCGATITSYWASMFGISRAYLKKLIGPSLHM